MIHAGAEHVDYAAVQELETPEGTDTHCPIAHRDVVDMVKYSLGFYGHDVTTEHHAITPDGARYFGILCLKSPYGDYTDMVGLRNSHDKKFPIGSSVGSQVCVCEQPCLQWRPPNQAPPHPEGQTRASWSRFLGR